MNRYILLFVSALLFQTGFSQKRATKTADLHFEASVPSFEEVAAKNKNTTVVLNTETGEIAALALIKGFRFKIALMEEHFNENYIESDRYPKATFKGKVYGFDLSKLTESSKDFSIKGTLELHGKTKEITAPAKIRKTENGIEVITNFSVTTDDFNIQIPKVVSNKVAKKVNIGLNCVLK